MFATFNSITKSCPFLVLMANVPTTQYQYCEVPRVRQVECVDTSPGTPHWQGSSLARRLVSAPSCRVVPTDGTSGWPWSGVELFLRMFRGSRTVEWRGTRLDQSVPGQEVWEITSVLSRKKSKEGWEPGPPSHSMTIFAQSLDWKNFVMYGKKGDYDIYRYIQKLLLEVTMNCKSNRLFIRSHGNMSDLVSNVDQRMFTNELFQPSFSSKSTFCESKFRPPTPRVYDGQEAPPGSFPWMASLQYKNKHFCGGSLISEQWVLTVAHCPDFPNVPDFISELKVSLGDHNLYTSTEADNLLLSVVKIINYPLYDQAGYNGDVALLKLKSPVIFHRNIRPICLPINDIDTYEKQIGIAAGWGKTETGDLPETLRYVELNIVPNVTCVMNLAMVNIDITDKMICTFKGPTGRETTCTGDSGGPLMVRRSGRYVLVGATSFSLVDCQSPFPNVFSRVSTFLEWISVAVMDYGSTLWYHQSINQFYCC